MKAILFNGGISGTTAVLVNSPAIFGKRALNKTNFKIDTWSQETHEVCWQEMFVQVENSSNFIDSEIIYQDKLQKYEKNDLFVSVVYTFKSVNTELWIQEGGDDEPAVDPIAGISSKETYYLAAL